MIDLKAFRSELGVTQLKMATAMGIALRSYEDLEAGRSVVRPIHVGAAKWASVKFKANGETTAPLSTDVSEMIRHALERDAEDARGKP